MGPTAKDVKWAAVKEISHGGGLVEVPIGSACDECYQIGAVVLQYPSFEAFVGTYNDDDDSGELQEEVPTIRANLRSPGSASPTTFRTPSSPCMWSAGCRRSSGATTAPP